LFSPDQKLGNLGEAWVFDQLRQRGHAVQRNTDFANAGYDMRIGELQIEVKYARQSYRMRWRRGEPVRVPRWQWLVHTTSQQNGHNWVLILVAEDVQGHLYPYILPGNLVIPRQHLQLTSHPIVYRGWLNDWKDEWSVIPYLAQKIYAQNGPTYRQWRVAAGGLKRGD